MSQFRTRDAASITRYHHLAPAVKPPLREHDSLLAGMYVYQMLVDVRERMCCARAQVRRKKSASLRVS